MDANQWECYVCLEAAPPLMANVCTCSGRYIHRACQKKLIEINERDARCSVCREKYYNVESIDRVPTLNKGRVLFRVICALIYMCGTALLMIVGYKFIRYDMSHEQSMWTECVVLMAMMGLWLCARIYHEHFVSHLPLYYERQEIRFSPDDAFGIPTPGSASPGEAYEQSGVMWAPVGSDSADTTEWKECRSCPSIPRSCADNGCDSTC